MMGLQDTGICGSSWTTGGFFLRYQRLECRDDDGAIPRPRRRPWLPSLNGKAVCSCFSPLKKLKWSRITSVLLLRKAPQASSKIRHASADDACPTVVFLSQWGLPVLSRPSSMAGAKARLPHGKGF
uniref:Uncharacterized protein n=1 Tax=Avena sativa TaxID=4498 RepID=A0ACD5XR43_AVESA